MSKPKNFLICIPDPESATIAYYVTSKVRTFEQGYATVFTSLAAANAAIDREGWINSTSKRSGTQTAYACEKIG